MAFSHDFCTSLQSQHILYEVFASGNTIGPLLVGFIAQDTLVTSVCFE